MSKIQETEIMVKRSSKLSRRQFLTLTAATGALALPTAVGYGLVRSVQGSSPPLLSPFAPVELLTSWPSEAVDPPPILVLLGGGADSPFGIYLSEILRAEGLNCLGMARVADLHYIPLEQFDCVLLAESSLDNSQSELLERYVTNGGRLIAMRPDPRLAALFGVELAMGSTAEGYIRVQADHPVAAGIVTEPLQFHGTADHYRSAGAEVIAWLSNSADGRYAFPALTSHRYGKGQAALWAFDLARSVAYTRQGNPAWANQERDDFWLVRPTDMFKGWIDLDRLHIPQADEQQRLLANLLHAVSQDARPLPRLWYFPGAVNSMFIATSDAHQDPATSVEKIITHVEQHGGQISVYYLPPLFEDWREIAQQARWWAASNSLMSEAYFPSPKHIANWRERGHEFTLHADVQAGLEESWQRYWKGFTGFGYGPLSPTTRTHGVAWTGWVETARVQASYGIRMNLDYYHVGPTFQDETGKWVNGHFIGSGLPMRFVDHEGRVMNIYQQPTQLADDHLLNLHWGGEVKLRPEEAIEVSRELLRRSQDGGHSAIAAIFHTDPFTAGEEWAAIEATWLDGTLDYAAEQGIPIWSAAEWLHFTEIRHSTELEAISWNPATGRLAFRLSAPEAPSVTLSLMVPLLHDNAELVQLEVDGSAIDYEARTLGGVTYGLVSIPARPCRISGIYTAS